MNPMTQLLKLTRSIWNSYSFGKKWKEIFKNNFGNYSIVEPGVVSVTVKVPTDIKAPPYIYGETEYIPQEPEIKTSLQIASMKASCAIAKVILDKVAKSIKIGRTTDELDKTAHKLCIDSKVYPSPLLYQGFPKSICTSVNNVACHGIPDNRPLKDGDIINVDVTVYFNGHHGDCSATYLVGNVDEEGRKLVSITERCLYEAISICRPGQEFSMIGEVIETVAETNGFAVVPCIAGHGIGNYFHGAPDIYHVSNEYPGRMAEGMTFTIEPVLTQGGVDIAVLDDGWTVVMRDNARTAQFEHTILITSEGNEILTK